MKEFIVEVVKAYSVFANSEKEAKDAATEANLTQILVRVHDIAKEQEVLEEQKTESDNAEAVVED